MKCVGAFCFAMIWRAGVLVCGERHVMGDIGNLGLVLDGSTRVGPGGEVQMMMSCSPVCLSSSSVAGLMGILVLCWPARVRLRI